MAARIAISFQKIALLRSKSRATTPVVARLDDSSGGMTRLDVFFFLTIH